MPSPLSDALTVVLPFVAAAAFFVAFAHAVLNVRDVRAAFGWAGVIVLLPIAGAMLYWAFGINRVKRNAVTRLRRSTWLDARKTLAKPHPEVADLGPLARLGDSVSGRPLLSGNRISPLVNGDETFPAMLAAIKDARHTVHLTSYIFDSDQLGMRFVEALGDAVDRGVHVRVVIDAVGARYSFPSIVRPLRRRGVHVARFNPTFFPPWRWKYTNLRCHRKLLIVDGTRGFTGGINIRHGHNILESPRHPALDLHFAIEGPVVADLQRAFHEDWTFATGRKVTEEGWYPELSSVGPVFARGITDGPDVDLNALRWTVLGAIASARTRVRLVTPYFLPEGEMLSQIRIAVMRGISVELIIPRRLNLRLVQWASESFLQDVLETGATIIGTMGHFDHSKVIVVDDAWALIGSTNLDPRSLRLNFEFNVECYDSELVGSLDALIDAKVASATPFTIDEVRAFGFFRRLRGGVMRLFTPYL